MGRGSKDQKESTPRTMDSRSCPCRAVPSLYTDILFLPFGSSRPEAISGGDRLRVVGASRRLGGVGGGGLLAVSVVENVVWAWRTISNAPKSMSKQPLLKEICKHRDLSWFVARLGPYFESTDMSPVVQSSVNDACEEPLGRTARAMAALRRRRAIWISCFHLRWCDFADICCPLRPDAMSAAF